MSLAFYIAVGEYYSKFFADNGFKIEVEEITAEYRKAVQKILANMFLTGCLARL